MICPLCKNEDIESELIQTDIVVEGYQNSFQIDVRRYFERQSFRLCTCHVCGYRFFKNHLLEGDSVFYEQLGRFSWYYDPFRWEHKTTMKLLRKGMKLLEVGCGNGGFLEKVNKLVSARGIELNNKAVQLCQSKDLLVKRSTVQEHAKEYAGYYDLVCSFQVLEHISDLTPFIKSQIDCLKNGGILVISVPNNESFIRFDDFDLLNMPPHHMGRWNSDSLKYLEKVFPLRLDHIYYEPLRHHHFDWYMSKVFVKISRYLPKIIAILHLRRFVHWLLRNFAPLIKGHTMLAVYVRI